MKRYIIDKKAIEILNLYTLDAITELGSDKVITNESLEYRHIPFISVPLSEEQLKVLDDNGIEYNEELIQGDMLLSQDTGYEKLRSGWVKTLARALTGAGTKVGHMDTGSTLSVVPYQFGYNFINNNTDVTDVNGHGTTTSSIIKHPIIAVAPGCELHVLKVITDQGLGNESAILAGFDYAIANNLDILNLSWTYDTPAVRVAIGNLVATNCIVVAAAGNSSTVAITLVPACLPGVVAVNAVSNTGVAGDFNVLPPPDIVGGHGITVACNGVSCQSYDKNGNFAGCWGTSCAAPFFVGVLAVLKEQLKETDNKKVLSYALDKCVKVDFSTYFGAGLPNF